MPFVPNSLRPLRFTIGTRLTLWGMGITLAVCAAAGGALYVGLSLSLHREVDRFLEGEAQEFLSLLHRESQTSLPDIERDIRRELGSRRRRDLTFRLLDSAGNVVIGSDPGDVLPPKRLEQAPPQHTPGLSRFETIRAPGLAAPLRVCSQWAELPGRGLFLVQATYTLSGISTSLREFRRICLAALLLAAVLSLIGGRVLARRILLPVRRMTRSARRIGATSLTRRLTRIGNHDELDSLAGVLNDMLDRLERQFKQIQQFTADAAHELRTPLAALRGNAEVALSANVAEEDLRKILETSIEEYDRLARIADDLLLLARADSGRPFLRPRRIDISTAVRDVVDLFSPLAQEKRIELSFPSDTALEIHADGSRLRQVLCNLLDNAIKFTPGGGRIAVALRRNAEVAIFTVSNSGPGIPPAHLPRVFDRFYRVDSARTRTRGGSGLGLAICRIIVEGHGGSIEAEHADWGTTFTVRLPIHSPGEESSNPRAGEG